MNEVNTESKVAAIKTLAIIGFITAIVLGVWVAVQVVRLAPSALSTLASIAESVYGPHITFEAHTDKNVVNAGDTTTLSWNHMQANGLYTFSYKCTEGISAQTRDAKGDIVTVLCDTPFPLDATKTSTDIIFASEKKRFTDITVTTRFTPESTSLTSSEKTFLVTVVNATIAEGVTATSTPVVTVPETPTPVEVPVVVKPKTPKPVTKHHIPVTPIPTPLLSNPNGYTDLQVTYLGIGTYDEVTKVFTPGTEIATGERGALRFVVKNIGTKVSTQWKYTVTLPNESKSVYTSPLISPLMPGESETTMIAFSDIASTPGNYTIKVQAADVNDTNLGNNSFEWTIKIVR